VVLGEGGGASEFTVEQAGNFRGVDFKPNEKIRELNYGQLV